MFAEEVRSFGKRLKGIFRSLSLRTQLLLILLFLLLTSIGSLTIIYAKSEELILEKVTDNIDDITKAIQISVEELTYRGDSTQRLKTYVDTLNKKGIREISILSDASEVIASSDPQKIGTVQQPPKKTVAADKPGRKKDLMITARLGEETGKKEGQRLYSVIMPVSIKGQKMGYIHVSMVLDDYKYLQRRNHLKRILSTIFAFSIGIIICLIFAEKYTDPIKRIATAAKKIAGGELVKIRDTGRGDEIGVMVKSFNEMVDKLSERKELEEKLKKTEQLSMIGQLASGIAHEVRNPLNFLSLSIGHIKERVTEENVSGRDDITALLDNLKKEIYRVNELINNFLFVGKPIVLNRTWVAPEALVSDALAMVKDKVTDEIELSYCLQGRRAGLLRRGIYEDLCHQSDSQLYPGDRGHGHDSHRMRKRRRVLLHFRNGQWEGCGSGRGWKDIRTILLHKKIWHRSWSHHHQKTYRRAWRHHFHGKLSRAKDRNHDKGAVS